ncbi:probable GPI-anchored adhesin-like protein PGA55 [Nicotiana tomentosiformis]|uniref:A-agglutinin anchorage subunit-like n=1 Tax=Nicotiana tabacum TaxID=4097 RepID=A0A1S4AJG7_TOBAC|nr:A-agglutinin anchorage subunit [Nicotiana tomentosiformis]XP_016476845.1 PREDICTED: A-agglutinin anchorage subunit-like [Nicotiana tabacum]
MEKDSKRDKKKKQKKWSCEKRSPLQDLNVIPKCKSKSSSTSSSMSISSNSFSSSSSSSSYTTPLHKKPKISSGTSNPVPKSSRLRSKSTNENDLPRPFSQNPKKIPPFLSGKKPTSQKLNLYSQSVKKSAFEVKGKSLKQKEGGNGSGEHIQLLDLDSNLTTYENCTPLGKLANHTNIGENSNTTSSNTTKTPPIEASVSPEIQCGISNVLVSAATPCYAAGHVLSGVTDKRKCKPRGILTIGTLVDCKKAGGSKDSKCSRDSLIPLPAEASMHWLLSPHRENCEGDSESEFRMLTGSATSQMPHSTSTCSGSSFGLLHRRGKYSDSVNQDMARSGGKARIILLSPRSPELKDLSYDKQERNLFPQAISCCNDVKVPDEWKCSCSLVRENSPCSTASLSSGNVIQTPKSESSSGKSGGFSWLRSGDRGKNFRSELDSVAECLQKTSLSPRTQTTSSWDQPNLHFKFTSTSWVSDSTLDNVSQSQMRISWRDGVVSHIFEMDDLDCCRCLSDDENGGYCHANAKTNLVEENDLLPESGLQSPEFLEHKHEHCRNGKSKAPPPEANLCAESIWTEGGELVSSADSDWTLSYKNQLYQV